MVSISKRLSKKINPIACLKDGFIITNGIPASKVPGTDVFTEKWVPHA